MKQNTFTVFIGDYKEMPLKALYDVSYDPLDLTNCTEIAASFPKVAGGFVTLTLSGSNIVIGAPAVLGKYVVTIDSVSSRLLKVGANQDFDVVFTIANRALTVRYTGGLTVLESGVLSQ